MPEISCDRRGALAQSPAHDLALECLFAGIEAATPDERVEASIEVSDGVLTVTDGDGTVSEYDLPGPGNGDDANATVDGVGGGDVILVGGGNAAGGLATALESVLDGRLSRGAVVTDFPRTQDSTVAGAADGDDDTRENIRSDTAGTDRAVEILPGDHPLPTERGVENSRRVLDIASSADEGDLVIVVISGGASALLAAPVEGISLADLQTVTTELLASGATIDEINAVRKHCSAIKGGRLALAAAPATVVTLALSDVVGDDPSVIGSGPTVPDPTTYADALDVIRRYDLDVPASVREHLEAGRHGNRPETPKRDDGTVDGEAYHVIANGRTALEAAAGVAEERGYDPLILAAGVRGEARESALTHLAIAEECTATGNPAEPPVVLLSGGETTVTLRDDPGQGGPNQEFALAAGLSLSVDGIVVASVDTDGIDGSGDVAGAIVDRSSVPAGEGRDALDRNDAGSVLEEAGVLIVTGPTGTNVNDLRVFVVD